MNIDATSLFSSASSSFRTLIIYPSIILISLRLDLVHCVQCKYYPYPYSSNNLAFNTTCHDICCSDQPATPSAACCSSQFQFSDGMYIGISIPLFCCFASVLAALCYCCMVTNRHFLRVICPCCHREIGGRASISPTNEYVPTVAMALKDEPPTYQEVYTKDAALLNKPDGSGPGTSNNKSGSDERRGEQVQSPEPPPYMNNSMGSANTHIENININNAHSTSNNTSNDLHAPTPFLV